MCISFLVVWRACHTRRLMSHLKSLGKRYWPRALRVSSSPVADRAPVSCLSLGPAAPAPAVLEVAANREPLDSHLSPAAQLAILRLAHMYHFRFPPNLTYSHFTRGA
ncbi:hypothetical protein JYU34_022582 [Plutella xylostella]|uniref:Uncharacterized protein n=1 Tax=Plutella xylostella TaxID=51655 RepID=A0ABQ7PPU7_PLUXY|nr:hypothetical protein JYU34_022582 [Plutella xylostella]